MTTRVLIYEDNNDLLEGLSMLVQATENFELAGAFNNCAGVEAQIESCCPDIVLMDIEMPFVNGIEGLKRIRSKNKQLPVIMLTVFDDNKNVFDAICAGASGYLLKRVTPAKMIEAIHDVLDGGAPMSSSIAKMVMQSFAIPAPNDYKLTPREKEVLEALVKGLNFKMIAAALNISIETVRTMMKRVYEKLQVHSQTEAVAKAIQQRIV